MDKKKNTKKQSFEELFKEYTHETVQRGQIVEGEILDIDDNIAFLDIGASRDAIVPGKDLAQLDEDFLNDLEIGDMIPVYVSSTVSENGELLVSINKGQAYKDWQRAERFLESGETIELKVTGYNKGGLQVTFGALQGFVPNSHVFELQKHRRVEDARAVKADKVGQMIRLQVIEVDRTKERLILSAKAEELARRKERLEELAIGQVITGTVVNLVNYGAFVNLGGVDGLVHISELAWRRLKHPSEVMKRGQEIEVMIKDIDIQRERVSLSRKALLPNPWEDFSSNHRVGELLEGTVSNVLDFGAFVTLTEDITGLIHVSALPLGSGQSPADYLQPGDRVEVEIESIDLIRERVGLSLHRGPILEVEETEEEEDPNTDEVTATSAEHVEDFADGSSADEHAHIAPEDDGLDTESAPVQFEPHEELV